MDTNKPSEREEQAVDMIYIPRSEYEELLKLKEEKELDDSGEA